MPNPRVGSRQLACSKAECQRRRKHLSQKRWLKRNQGYFNGRYANTKRWLQEHPGYLADYRRRNPARVARDNERRKSRHQEAQQAAADIQDSISLQPHVIKKLTPHLAATGNADIQDSIWSQIIAVSIFSAHYVQRRYTRLDRLNPRPDVESPQSLGEALPQPG
jgi:hypothetical protein